MIQVLADGVTPAVTMSYVSGLRLDETLGATTITGKSDYITDRLGSTLAIVDANGNVSTSISYEPFGAARATGGPDAGIRFTGRDNDETGLVYLRARYYDPRTGAFVSEDPLGIDSGVTNLYSYSDGDPVNGLDPTGLSKVVFSSNLGLFVVLDDSGNWVASYPGGNFTTNPSGDPLVVGSNGPAPIGVFPVQPPIDTRGRLEYGPYFFPIGARGPGGKRLDIARRRGLGFHGGRSGPRSRTQGCIRLFDSDILKLYDFYLLDPITEIIIQ